MERLIKILFFVALIIYFLILVAARTPAQWGAYTVVQSVPNVRLAGVSGTLWSGRAAGAQVDLQGQVLDLGVLQWQLNPLSLLAMRGCVEISSDRLNGTACRNLLTGQNSIENAFVDQLSAGMFNDELMVNLGGTAGLTVRRAVVNDHGSLKELDGSLSWQRARINAGDGWFQLGDFGADLTHNPRGGVVAQIYDVEGPFAVDLHVEYTPGEPQPRLNGVINPRPNAPPAIINALSVFTEMLDDGSFRVVWPMDG